jgi:decaprenyl-phosphate phosphoribosyltransferase
MIALIQLLRIRQWVKNGFVLAPMFFSAEIFHGTAVLQSLAAFVVFCLLSSAVYIFNDWRDLEADRAHLKKRSRPLASGTVSVPTALSLAAALMVGAGILTILLDLPKGFSLTLAAYVAINVSYSLGLKQVPLLELFLVASGFMLRLLAGAYASQVQLLPWMAIATATLALLVTVGKRRGDLAQQNELESRRRPFDQYNLAYLDSMVSALVGATLVVYLLFCVSDYAVARYGSLVVLTTIPVALGLLRYVQLIMVKGQGESPTDLVMGDPGMITIIVVFIMMFTNFIYF